MASWPSTLPAPLSNGYEIKPQEQVIRTDMEKGPARVRHVTTANTDRVKLGWEMTDEQLAIYRPWFKTDIAGGAMWFTISLVVGTIGFKEMSARFVGVPNIVYLPVLRWLVTGEVELR
jgi:hypothetical protein